MSRIYGYGRISRKTQKIERQVENISKAYPTATIITEAFTGTKIDRPEFAKLLKKISTGDTIVFDSVSRMSRNADEGFQLYKELFDKGINLVFLKEPHIDTSSYKKALEGVISIQIQSGDEATDDLINSIMAAVNRFMMNKVENDIRIAFEQAQKEVDDLHKRTSEGLREAKRKGKRVGCSKGDKLVTKKSIEAKEKIRKYNNTFGGALNNEDTWKLIGISKMTFYKYKNEMMAAEH